jgi:hypothetical protein
MKDALHGAYLCLSRDNISYIESVPKELRLGWEFAFWYCQAHKTKIVDPNDLIKAPRVSSIAVTGQVWGQSLGVAILTKVNNLVREAAKARSSRFCSIKTLLVNKQVVLSKFCGKRPVAGLYTQEELAVVNEYYDYKVECITKVYGNIPDDWKSFGPSGLHSYFNEFSIKNPAKIQIIEDNRSKRIPELLVVTRRGKQQDKSIAKGSTLNEKLISIDGGDSVRTIGRIMWSPLCGVTQINFINQCMSITSEIVHKKNISSSEIISVTLSELSGGEKDKTQDWKKAEGLIHDCVSVYLECIPRREKDLSWTQVFGFHGK